MSDLSGLLKLQIDKLKRQNAAAVLTSDSIAALEKLNSKDVTAIKLIASLKHKLTGQIALAKSSHEDLMFIQSTQTPVLEEPAPSRRPSSK